MAYAFRAASTQGNASGGALTVTKPTGTVNGDLIVVVGYLETDTNTWSSVGSGFTSAGSFTNTGAFKMQVWWKIASSEPASWTWTPTSSNWRTVHAASWSGATGTGTTRVDVFGTSGQADGANETVQTAPSITPTVTGDLLVFAYGNFGGATATSLTGAATGLRANVGGVIIGSNESATTSATGTTRPVSTGTQDYAAIHVAFFLDTGGGPTDYPRTTTSSIAHTATFARAFAGGRAVTSSVAHTAARARAFAGTRTLVSSIASSATTTRVVTSAGAYARAIASSVAHSAVVARVFGAVRAATASVAHSSAATSLTNRPRAVASSVAHSSAAARLTNRPRALAVSVAHSATVARLGAFGRSLSSSIAHGAGVARSGSFEVIRALRSAFHTAIGIRF